MKLKETWIFQIFTATDLQDNLKGPNFFDEYREQVTKRMEDGAYMNILALYR